MPKPREASFFPPFLLLVLIGDTHLTFILFHFVFYFFQLVAPECRWDHRQRNQAPALQNQGSHSSCHFLQPRDLRHHRRRHWQLSWPNSSHPDTFQLLKNFCHWTDPPRVQVHSTSGARRFSLCSPSRRHPDPHSQISARLRGEIRALILTPILFIHIVSILSQMFSQCPPVGFILEKEERKRKRLLLLQLCQHGHVQRSSCCHLPGQGGQEARRQR